MGTVNYPTLLPWILVLAAGFNSCIGNLLLKRSRADVSDGLLGMLLSPWFIGGLFFYGINVILFAKSLESLPVSRAYPVLAGVGFLLITITGNIWFNERFATIHWCGLAAILAGIWCITR